MNRADVFHPLLAAPLAAACLLATGLLGPPVVAGSPLRDTPPVSTPTATDAPTSEPTATAEPTATPEPTPAPTPTVAPVLHDVDPLAPKAAAPSTTQGAWPTPVIIGILLTGLAALAYGGFEFFRAARRPAE